MSSFRRFIPETARCVCGHTYADHLAKAPNRCTEGNAARPGHRCSCIEFKMPIGPFPDSLDMARDRTLTSAADHEFQRVLGSIPRNSNGFDFS